jgi:hypothetical protein
LDSIEQSAMTPRVEPVPDKEVPKPEPSRQEEALRIVKYVDDLREIIKNLRRHLN